MWRQGNATAKGSSGRYFEIYLTQYTMHAIILIRHKMLRSDWVCTMITLSKRLHALNVSRKYKRLCCSRSTHSTCDKTWTCLLPSYHRQFPTIVNDKEYIWLCFVQYIYSHRHVNVLTSNATIRWITDNAPLIADQNNKMHKTLYVPYDKTGPFAVCRSWGKCVGKIVGVN